jgi:protein phosphatase
VQVDIEGPHAVMPGDVYVLCSDGLSNLITDQELGAILTIFPLAEACPFLIDIANLRGGPDNITVVAARVAGEAPPADTQPPKATYSFRSGLPWWKRLPWYLQALSGGMALGILALLLAVGGVQGLSIFIFTMAVIVLMAGLYGVFRNYQREVSGEEDGNEPSGPPQVYRAAACSVDKTLIERFTQNFSQVLEVVKEKGFAFDTAKLQKHQAAFDEAVKKNDLPGAFRARCRALSILLVTLRGHRGKDERFKPNWHGPYEKSSNNSHNATNPLHDLDTDIELEPS